MLASSSLRAARLSESRPPAEATYQLLLGDPPRSLSLAARAPNGFVFSFACAASKTSLSRFGANINQPKAPRAARLDASRHVWSHQCG